MRERKTFDVVFYHRLSFPFIIVMYLFILLSLFVFPPPREKQSWSFSLVNPVNTTERISSTDKTHRKSVWLNCGKKTSPSPCDSSQTTALFSFHHHKEQDEDDRQKMSGCILTRNTNTFSLFIMHNTWESLYEYFFLPVHALDHSLGVRCFIFSSFISSSIVILPPCLLLCQSLETNRVIWRKEREKRFREGKDRLRTYCLGMSFLPFIWKSRGWLTVSHRW